MGEGESRADTGSIIDVFERIVNNPFSRFLLRQASSYCEKDGGNRVEVALQLYLEKRRKACSSCTLLSKIVKYVVKKGAESFGVSEGQ